MGIKGIYGEIGPGERIALSKLAIENLEKTGRPLRIAIDISIWQFQIQAGQGGSNPAIRTFYYRLLRLLSVSVQPLFVFDGPNKPPFKRNKKSGHHGASIPNMMCKQLLNLFGFPSHTAPGEAEAECAYLQREGIVDAVLSEDVDTLMFGCGVTLRNWSSENSKGKTPTHVSLYNSKATKAGTSGLDREGMILVALMSGGDYITEGIPGCGIKLACQAARAGFGKSLCQLSRSDSAGLNEWRENLSHEIRTNESKFFRVKHKSVTIPDNFPNKEVLGYYTHPVVSSSAKIEKLKTEIEWDGDVNIPGLRSFVIEAFDWTHKAGARKFIRGLAPVLLVHKLRLRGNRRRSGYGDVVLTAMNEMKLVRAICGQRKHFSADGIPELRVVYHPNDIVGLDLDAEEDDNEDYGRDGLAPVHDDDQIEAYLSDEPAASSRPPDNKAASAYDPTEPDKLWILETIAKIGVPLKVEDYEESLRNPKKFIKAKATAKKAATKGSMPKGAIEKFVKVSKSGVENTNPSESKLPRITTASSPRPILPPAYLAPSLERLTSSQSASVDTTSAIKASRTRSSVRIGKNGPASISKENAKSKTRSRAVFKKPAPNENPWTLAKSSPAAQDMPTVAKLLSQHDKSSIPEPFKQPQFFTPNLSASPPPRAPSAVSHPRKRSQSPQNENTYEEPTTTITPHRRVSTVNQLPLAPSSDEKTVIESPRKNRTPISASSTTSPALRQSARSKIAHSTPEPVNRKLDFLSAARSRTSSSPLPVLRDELSQTPEQVGREVISISSSPEVLRETHINMASRQHSPMKAAAEPPPEVKSKIKEGKKYIMLRDSLPGGWKEVSEDQLAERSGRAWRLSRVEVLDMTEE